MSFFKRILSFFSKRINSNILVALGTWAIVIVTLLIFKENSEHNRENLKWTVDSYITSWKHNVKVLDMMQKAFEMQWRPILTIKHAKWEKHFCDYCWSDDNNELKCVPFNEINSYSEFEKVEFLKYSMKYNVAIKNAGNNSARLILRFDSLLTPDFWTDSLHKSADSLVSYIKNRRTLAENDVDIIVKRDSTLYTNIGKIETLIKREILEDYITDSFITVYPFTYIEYADFLGNKYNRLFLEHWRFKFGLDKNFDIVPVGKPKVGLEKDRSDLLLKKHN